MQALLSAAILLLVTSSATASSQCNDTYQQCIQLSNGSNFQFDDVLPTYYPLPVLQEYCSAFDQFWRCMSPVLSNCSWNDQASYTGMNDAFIYLCNETKRSDYMLYASCFSSAPELRPQIEDCTTTVDANMRGITGSTSQQITQWCQYYNDYVNCMAEYVKLSCGSAASDWQTNYVNTLYSRITTPLNCNSDGSWTVSSIIIIAFIALTVVLMLGIIIAFIVVFRRRQARLREITEIRRRRPSLQDLPPLTPEEREARGMPPAYDGPYVIYHPPAEEGGEPRLMIVTPPSLDSAASDGVKLEPTTLGKLPRYGDEPPPAFSDVVAGSGESSGAPTGSDNLGYQGDQVEGGATSAVPVRRRERPPQYEAVSRPETRVSSTPAAETGGGGSTAACETDVESSVP